MTCISFAILVLATCVFFFFQAEDGIRDATVTGVQTCALPISWGQRAAPASMGPGRWPVMAPGAPAGDGPGGRHALAGAVAAAVALGATELAAGALAGAPSLVQSIASAVIDLAPIGVVRAAIATLGSRDKPALVAGVVALSLLFGAGLALAARRRRWVAVVGLAAFGALGAWAGARPPDTVLWRPALTAAAGVLAGVATLAALVWRHRRPAPAPAPAPAP